MAPASDFPGSETPHFEPAEGSSKQLCRRSDPARFCLQLLSESKEPDRRLVGRDLARPFDGADRLDPAERGEEPRLPPPGWNKASAESRYPGRGSCTVPRCDAIRCKSAALVLLFLVGAKGAEIHPSSRFHTLSFTLTLHFSSSGCRTLVSRLRLLLP